MRTRKSGLSPDVSTHNNARGRLVQIGPQNRPQRCMGYNESIPIAFELELRGMRDVFR